MILIDTYVLGKPSVNRPSKQSFQKRSLCLAARIRHQFLYKAVSAQGIGHLMASIAIDQNDGLLTVDEGFALGKLAI